MLVGTCSLQVPLSVGSSHLQSSNAKTLATLTSSFSENLEVSTLYTVTPVSATQILLVSPISTRLISRRTWHSLVLTVGFSSSLLVEDKNSHTHTQQQQWVSDRKETNCVRGFRTLRNAFHSLITIMAKFIDY